MIAATLYSLGVVLIAGFIFGLTANRFRLPRVTGYIIAGMILSPSFSPFISKPVADDLDVLISAALSIVAYLIGGHLHLGMMRRDWKRITLITILQGIGGLVLAAGVVAYAAQYLSPLQGATFLNIYLPMGLLIGSIAWATSPAVTLSVVAECKAKGPAVSTMISVVAFTDLTAVIAFSVSLEVARQLVNGSGTYSVLILAGPLLHIAEALVLGCLAGLLIVWIGGRATGARSLLMATVLGSILLSTGVATEMGTSAVLACMTAGAFVNNVGKKPQLFSTLEPMEDIVFVLFFVLSGMHFDPKAMLAAGFLPLIIEMTSCGGKWIGASFGGLLAGEPAETRSHLGLAILPKGGLNIGLAFIARKAFPEFGDLMFNAVLASTVINMLITPPVMKYTVTKICELQER